MSLVSSLLRLENDFRQKTIHVRKLGNMRQNAYFAVTEYAEIVECVLRQDKSFLRTSEKKYNIGIEIGDLLSQILSIQLSEKPPAPEPIDTALLEVLTGLAFVVLLASAGEKMDNGDLDLLIESLASVASVYGLSLQDCLEAAHRKTVKKAAEVDSTILDQRMWWNAE